MVTKNQLNIGIPVYPGVDLLDVVGPYEIFSWMGQIWTEQRTQVFLVAATCAPIVSLNNLAVIPQQTFAGCPPLDVLFVPGAGPQGLLPAMQDETYLAFLRQQGGQATYVSSVCVGAFLLATAGLLDGFQATTYWALVPCLQLFPKIKVVNGYPRYVVDGNRVTGGGISSGLDQALKMVALITNDEQIARQVQLTIQYHPRPPFNDGDPCVAEYAVYAPAYEGANAGYVEPLCKLVREITGPKVAQPV